MTGEREAAAHEVAAEPDRAAPDVAPESPEGFRLAGELPAVMRLSRKMMMMLGGAAGTAVGGALLWALAGDAPRKARELYDVTGPGQPEVFADTASDYAAAPQLGRPLPGDLGRPILSAQREADAPARGARASGPPDPGIAAAEQGRRRAEQNRAAARASRLFHASGEEAATAAATETGRAPVSDGANADNDRAADSRRSFLAARERKPFESAERIEAPGSPHVVQAGTLIPAALITGIRSDLPGPITAQVTQNVYDSPTGRILLIPQGARLVGDYDSEIAAGQTRILLAWDRLILPGGRSIRLERQPGTDASGMAGIADRVDNHWGRMARAALVSTLLGIGGHLSASGEGELAHILRSGTQDAAAETGRRLVERELAVQPTLTARPGLALRVVVTRDLILEPEEIIP